MGRWGWNLLLKNKKCKSSNVLSEMETLDSSLQIKRNCLRFVEVLTPFYKTKTCSKRRSNVSFGLHEIKHSTRAEEQQHHEERMCKFRQVHCSLGCDTALTALN